MKDVDVTDLVFGILFALLAYTILLFGIYAFLTSIWAGIVVLPLALGGCISFALISYNELKQAFRNRRKP